MNTLLALLLGLLVLGLGAIWILLTYLSPTKTQTHPDELCYATAHNPALRPLPSVHDTASLYLSVIIPAYNEKDRLTLMLDETIQFLTSTLTGDWEILLMDDGSTDGTAQVALTYASKLITANKLEDEQLRVCKFIHNKGKGATVSHVRITVLTCRVCSM